LVIYLNNIMNISLVQKQYNMKIMVMQELCFQLSSLNGLKELKKHPARRC
jgi:hypothetical protein